MPRTELFVGNLTRDVNRRDIENVFEKYGRLIKCNLKSKEMTNKGVGPNYAFVEYEDERDAEDALRAENGKDMLGTSMVVEWAKTKVDRRDYGRDRDRYGGGGRDYGSRSIRSLECYECGERGHFARDCRNRRGSGRNRISRDRDSSRSRRHGSRDRRRHSRSYSRSNSRRRSYSRSKNHSKSHSRDRSHSRNRNRSKDRSRDRNNHSRDRSYSRPRSASKTRTHSRRRSNHSRTKSRSRSPTTNGRASNGRSRSPAQMNISNHSSHKSRSRSPTNGRENNSDNRINDNENSNHE